MPGVDVCDIDETLRDNDRNRCIGGSRALLRAIVRDLGLRIVYLTAGSAAIRGINRRFLRRGGYPRGMLIDRPLGDDSPNHVFKSRILRRLLRAATPRRGGLACLGDNRTGDARAYGAHCAAGVVLRLVSPWGPHNRPRRRAAVGPVVHWRGHAYTRAVRARILRQLRRAAAAHGAPTAAPRAVAAGASSSGGTARRRSSRRRATP